MKWNLNWVEGPQGDGPEVGHHFEVPAHIQNQQVSYGF
jgi:hypothetical protein